MANQIAVLINPSFIGDGVSTTFSFDLVTDPYYGQGGGVELFNWFSSDRKAAAPVGVFLQGDQLANTATLVGTVVTVGFSQPPSGVQNFLLYILF